jgi:hypothetical protein
MPSPIDTAMFDTISKYDTDKRYKYLLTEAAANGELWILTDKHGCVMLNSEDDDCVPIWPNKEFAQAWATGEWSECEAESISLQKWLSSWTSGLEEDDLAIAIFPNQDEDGLVVYPDELDYELRQSQKKA